MQVKRTLHSKSKDKRRLSRVKIASGGNKLGGKRGIRQMEYGIILQKSAKKIFFSPFALANVKFLLYLCTRNERKPKVEKVERLLRSKQKGKRHH